MLFDFLLRNTFVVVQCDRTSHYPSNKCQYIRPAIPGLCEVLPCLSRPQLDRWDCPGGDLEYDMTIISREDVVLSQRPGHPTSTCYLSMQQSERSFFPYTGTIGELEESTKHIANNCPFSLRGVSMFFLILKFSTSK